MYLYVRGIDFASFYSILELSRTCCIFSSSFHLFNCHLYYYGVIHMKVWWGSVLCCVFCFFKFFFDPVSCIASVSGLSILDCPFGFLWRLFRITERLPVMDIVNEKRQVRSPLSFARRDHSHYHPLLMELSTIFRVREGMSNFRLFCYGVYIFTVCSIPN